MNFKEVMDAARGNMGPYCKVCPVCDGRACKNQMPGPGAKGIGDTAIRNYDKWKEFRVQMDIDTAGNINGVKIVHLADFLLRGEL